MKRDDVLEIAQRLKSEGRAISPVTVCLEAYGQSLSEIAATLQQWREERIVPVDSAPATLSTPEDFGDVMRDAIERCWAVAQKGVRGQVDAEIRALKDRTEQAERETGMLYIDLTRTLSELEACKRRVSELQHSAAGAPRMIAIGETDAVPAITDGSAATASEALTETECYPSTSASTSAFDERSAIVEEQADGAWIDSASVDVHAASDSSGVTLPFDEMDSVSPETALVDTVQASTPEPDLAVEPDDDLLERALQVLLPEPKGADKSSEQLALAETRASTAEARVQELEAQLANVTQSADPSASDPTPPHSSPDEAQRIAALETAFAQERQVLQTKLDDAILQGLRWKQRAEQQRMDVAPLKEHAAWVSAQSVGRSALCSRLIVELAQVSPGNPLLRKEVQQQIIDQAAQSHTG
ncbi:DNA-binding protein [Paraburkholderia fungorum]|uniref:KfrA N-terminal DNA-binding domain-containing protein n=1 Tax=Paraburkholderia fungorum TaxID=134537 RepID=A0A420G6T5_9BURK|nr:DNA-binding protein [Paraburkholderia fungorum]RKF40848.1 hypothetical protein BCY88_32130 [Paraburkholderia fungorum]